MIMNNWKVMFIAFVVLNILDLLSTPLVVGISGETAEMNLFLRWVIVECGMFGVLLVKIIGCGIVIKMKNIIRPFVLFIVNLILAMVVIGNFLHYSMLVS